MINCDITYSASSLRQLSSSCNCTCIKRTNPIWLLGVVRVVCNMHVEIFFFYICDYVIFHTSHLNLHFSIDPFIHPIERIDYLVDHRLLVIVQHQQNDGSLKDTDGSWVIPWRQFWRRSVRKSPIWAEGAKRAASWRCRSWRWGTCTWLMKGSNAKTDTQYNSSSVARKRSTVPISSQMSPDTNEPFLWHVSWL